MIDAGWINGIIQQTKVSEKRCAQERPQIALETQNPETRVLRPLRDS